MSDAARSRDRAQTGAAILAAAEAQLAEAGFRAFGVNAVARRAGCDKQLIYRYYGGMEAARGGLTPPPGIDEPALNALLIGGIQQLVLASATMGSFAGLPLSEDRNWIRARLALRALIRGVYRPAHMAADLLPGS